MLAVLGLAPEYTLFGAAGVVTLVAFIGLILVPSLGSFGRPWEKAAAGQGSSRNRSGSYTVIISFSLCARC